MSFCYKKFDNWFLSTQKALPSLFCFLSVETVNTVLIFINSLAANVNGDNAHSFIVNYFDYKQTPSVIGYSCNTLMDDIILVKDFNKYGMKISLLKLNNTPGIQIFGNTSYFKLGVFLDARCNTKNNITAFFAEASNYRMYDELRHWLVLVDNFDNILSSIGDEAFGVSTDFVIAVLSDHDNYSKLYDVYNFGKTIGGSLNITFLGYWNKNDKFSITLSETKPRRRSNLHGTILRVAFLRTVYKPLEMSLSDYFQDYSSFKKEGLWKFGFNVLKHLSELLNFTVVSFEVGHWEAGDRIGPVVRAMNHSAADFAGTALTMNVPRTYLVKYVHQDWPFRTCFIFRSPQPKNIKIQEIFRPLSYQVWYLMVLLLSLSMIILLAIVRHDWNDSETMNISHTILLIVGTLCQQATDMQMKNLSTRLAYLSVLIFGLLIYNYYSAGVVSARLNEPIFRVNDSLNQLSNLPLKLSSEYMPYLEFVMKRPDWEAKTFITKRWEPIPKSDRFMPPEKAMHLVRTGQYAYHTHPEVAYPFIDRYYDNREICELTEVHVLRPSLATFALTFNSTIVEVVRVGLAKISEVGLRSRQITRWNYKKPSCRIDVLSTSSVNIYEFLPHVFLLLIGVFMSFIIFISEIFIANRVTDNIMRLKNPDLV